MDMASNEGESRDSVEIENSNPPLVTSIRQMIDVLPPLSPYICIYRAPLSVRQINEKAYTPQKVSIGPLHHGKENLLHMEEQKLRYLSSFLDHSKLSLEDCISFIRELEVTIRNCYAESIKLSSDEFVKMILVDSSFIIDIILRYDFYLETESEIDYLGKPFKLVDVVRTDMILLENQIPYFVLEGLFNLAFPQRSFVSLSIMYFMATTLFHKIPNIPNIISSSEVKHFVDLLRLFHLPSILRPRPRKRVNFMTIPTARELQEVGLSIRTRSSDNILDIQFVKGILTIPQFIIRSSSSVLLRNLIAFEVCHYPDDSYIIDYVVFMESLMDNAQDVDILIQNGIFENRDRAWITTFFHDLRLDVWWSDSRYYYWGLCQEVNAYSKVPRYKWEAIMKRDYFSTPWKIVATVAAIMLVVLNFIQTICSIISVSK